MSLRRDENRLLAAGSKIGAYSPLQRNHVTQITHPDHLCVLRTFINLASHISVL